MKYKYLFEPITIGDKMFRNRIFAAPTGALNMTPEGFPTPDMCTYYEMKAMGGAASVCVGEGLVDSSTGRSNHFHPMLDNIMGKPHFSALARSICRHGAVAAMELQHAGASAKISKEKSGVCYSSVNMMTRYGYEAGEMPPEIIEKTIRAFGDAALFLKQCGFGMVLIHGGHGWLLSQFLSPGVNKRKDEWGGSFENRMRLPLAIISDIRKKCGRGFPIEFRMSGTECTETGYDIDEGVRIAKALDGKVDIIHVSTGSHEDDESFYITHPTMFLDEGCNVKYAAEIKKHVCTPVATVGGHVEPSMMEEVIASGQADIVEVARELICDPFFPRKAREGREGDIRKCMRCLSCFSSIIDNGFFSCAINPVTSNETQVLYDNENVETKKVLVVGGGIGGMQAALTAAGRGHDVILCEKTDRLGGVLLCEDKVPFKSRLKDYISYQVKAIADAGVDIRLNTRVTPEYAKTVGADVIIASLGAVPSVPKIPGINGENVLGAVDAYFNESRVGNKVVILGGGLVGSELGLYLSIRGREVTILEMLPELNFGENFLHGRGLFYELRRRGIGINLSTKAVEINEKGVVAQKDSETVLYEADTVIYATGMDPLRDEAASLRFCAPEFHQLGDCLAPMNIKAATSAAFQAARDIGRYF
jgi:2,4-dienoyl-CoA reductase-like NADH-dependent reductase (Old Yellow Enzyme family)/thioredoxin reductase